MSSPVQTLKGCKFKYVTNKNIEFIPDYYKEFDCTRNGKTEPVYLISVMPDPYDFLEDNCLVISLKMYNNMSPEEKKQSLGFPVKGKTLKGYKDFILDFYPPGM
jgi:hypothetical protein